MTDSPSLPTLLVPGLLSSPRLFAEQIPELWRLGPVTVAIHTRDDSMGAIAMRILASAPPRFALAGLSMGGYICFEILRQAPERVAKLVLLDTTARPDAPEQSEQRRSQIEMARAGRLGEVADMLFPRMVHARRWGDEALRRIWRTMAQEVGPEGFSNQQTAIMGRPDSRPGLAAIRCPTLVVVGDGDVLTPPERAEEIANGVPGARLSVIRDSGHLSTLEQPAAVTRSMQEFLLRDA
ncbi:MAG: alpha/beta fold hydrolase [Gammaproteobacteria bacterium]|nr:alpha/beta fold hydrolase [Gammaproteobacteria bacterium]MDE2261485.1 alpha/beta fold hydrolase [Gammaproteobacteria bacterium]